MTSDGIAQQQPSKLRGGIMATGFADWTATTAGTTTTSGWTNVRVDNYGSMVNDLIAKLPPTPIQQLRKDIGSWLKPLL